MSSRIKAQKSSGNVFADLGLANAELLMVKADLVHRIGQVIRERRLTQGEAADVLGIDQPKVSALLRGQLEGYSIERLMRFLVALGYQIEVKVSRKARTTRAGVRAVGVVHD